MDYSEQLSERRRELCIDCSSKHNAANSNNETMMTMMTMIIVRVTMAMGMVTVMMFINMMLEIVLIYLVKLADHGE